MRSQEISSALTSIFALKGSLFWSPPIPIYPFLTKRYNGWRHEAKQGIKVCQYPRIPTKACTCFTFLKYGVGLYFFYDSIGLPRSFDSPKTFYCSAQTLDFLQIHCPSSCRWSSKAGRVLCNRSNCSQNQCQSKQWLCISRGPIHGEFHKRPLTSPFGPHLGTILALILYLRRWRGT